MYELRTIDNNELLMWSEYPDEIKEMRRTSIYGTYETYIIFNPKSAMKD